MSAQPQTQEPLPVGCSILFISCSPVTESMYFHWGFISNVSQGCSCRVSGIQLRGRRERAVGFTLACSWSAECWSSRFASTRASFSLVWPQLPQCRPAPLSRNNIVNLWLSWCYLVIPVAQPGPILGNTEPVCRGELGLVLKLADCALATVVPVEGSQGWRVNRDEPVLGFSF